MNQIEQTKLEREIAHLEGEREELRDRFAMAALAGPLAKYSTFENWDGIAGDAYKIADAMLSARRRKPAGRREEQ